MRKEIIMNGFALDKITTVAIMMRKMRTDASIRTTRFFTGVMNVDTIFAKIVMTTMASHTTMTS